MSDSFNGNPFLSDSLWEIANTDTSELLNHRVEHEQKEPEPVIMDCLDEMGNPEILPNVYSVYNPNLHYRKKQTNYDKNMHPLGELSFKVQKSYDKLLNRTQHYLNEHQPENYSEDRDLERLKTISITGGIITAVGIAGYLVSTLSTPPENAAEIYKNLGDLTGGLAIAGAASAILPSTYYLLKTLKVSAFSFSNDCINRIVESNKKKYEVNKVTIELLDDLKADKNDPSLTFAKHFIHNADLRRNSKKVNRKIINGVALYRNKQLKYLKGEISKEELEEAYGEMIRIFEEVMGMEGCSIDFYKGPYINSFIQDYHRRQGEIKYGLDNPRPYGKSA